MNTDTLKSPTQSFDNCLKVFEVFLMFDDLHAETYYIVNVIVAAVNSTEASILAEHYCNKYEYLGACNSVEVEHLYSPNNGPFIIQGDIKHER